MAEPTSTLKFADLIIEVARKAGYAYRGQGGNQVVQMPTDEHDLDDCKRHVNNAIRMFIADAPPSGWKWARPVASLTLWGDVATNTANKAVSLGYDPATDKTTLQVTTAAFYPSMELHTITLTGVDDFTITDYISSTVIKVSGDATAAGTAGVTWSMTMTGDYTLPRTFGGQFSGRITYGPNSDASWQISWISEETIREYRASTLTYSGDPYLAAIKLLETGSPRRRWTLSVFPNPQSNIVLQFPYDLYFDKLVDLDDVPPCPFTHDETIKAACLAVVEKDIEGMPGLDWQYYKETCLPNSYRIDARSGPKSVGNLGDKIPKWLDYDQRMYPPVTFNQS